MSALLSIRVVVGRTLLNWLWKGELTLCEERQQKFYSSLSISLLLSFLSPKDLKNYLLFWKLGIFHSILPQFSLTSRHQSSREKKVWISFCFSWFVACYWLNRKFSLKWDHGTFMSDFVFKFFSFDRRTKSRQRLRKIFALAVGLQTSSIFLSESWFSSFKVTAPR